MDFPPDSRTPIPKPRSPDDLEFQRERPHSFTFDLRNLGGTPTGITFVPPSPRVCSVAQRALGPGPISFSASHPVALPQKTTFNRGTLELGDRSRLLVSRYRRGGKCGDSKSPMYAPRSRRSTGLTWAHPQIHLSISMVNRLKFCSHETPPEALFSL